MLSTFLSQLQSYFSKYFFLGSLSPILAFAFLNGVMAYFLSDSFRHWVESDLFTKTTVGRGAFLSTSLVVGIVLAAYVLSALSTFLRQKLEGRWGAALARLFIPAQNRRRQRMVKDLQDAANDEADLASAPEWEHQLRVAREEGRKNRQGVAFTAPTQDSVAEALNDLKSLYGKYEVPEATKLEQLVNDLTQRFRDCDVDKSPELDEQHVALFTFIDYAAERARARHARFQNELNSNFGDQDMAPTKMGNVANTIQSYAMRRYRCNLETIWSNLQQVVQKDDKAQAALQEAKTQLDFLIACCWLTLLWTAIWSVHLAVLRPSRTLFIVVALTGPMIAYLWYRAAAEQYRSFADVAMTSLDMFRLELLRTMRLRSPADVEEERWTWKSLDQLNTYGEERNFRYEPGKPA